MVAVSKKQTIFVQGDLSSKREFARFEVFNGADLNEVSVASAG